MLLWLILHLYRFEVLRLLLVELYNTVLNIITSFLVNFPTRHLFITLEMLSTYIRSSATSIALCQSRKSYPGNKNMSLKQRSECTEIMTQESKMTSCQLGNLSWKAIVCSGRERTPCFVHNILSDKKLLMCQC